MAEEATTHRAPFDEDVEEAEVQVVLSEERTELAERRTQLALQRTVWSAERTLNAWLRTSLAAVAAGLAVYEFVSSGVEWLPQAVGVIMTASGAGMYVFALWRYRQELAQLSAAGAQTTPLWIVGLFVIPLLLASVLALVVIVR